MDVDLEGAEIVFAQKLACGEPPTRARALRALQDWIKEQSTKKAFGEKDFMRLCKGLHYVMWMQDKMLMQEELAEKISHLIEHFKTEAERVLYFECFFRSLGKEWKAIDRWRMDKFLMLIRRVVRVVFHYLKMKKWNSKITELYFDALRKTVISTGIIQEFLVYLLRPDNAGRRYLFESILTEIFATILQHFSLSLLGNEETEELEEELPACARMDEGVKERKSIEFDYEFIGKRLFDIGKRPECSSERRKKLYDLAKKYNKAITGSDPLAEKEYEPEMVLTEEMVEEATTNLMKFGNESKKLRKQYAKAKKIKAADFAATVAPEIVRDKTGVKIRRKMKQKQQALKKERIAKLAETGHVKKRKPKLSTKSGGEQKPSTPKSAKQKTKKAK